MLYMETILEALSAVRPVTAGATSLIAAMADEIGLADIIDRCCEWDKTRCKISPGKAIEVVLGYSKDRRPDLKQIQFGIGVTREGVLNYGEVLSGSSSDKTWNRATLGKVKTMFPPEVLKDLI